MRAEILRKWEREFRRAALADGFANLRDHLRRLDLPDSPSLLLEGTIHVMRMCFVWAAVDNRTKGFDEFLAMQTYDPTRATGARFTATFDIFGRAFARIQLDSEFGNVDLADLYGSAWDAYRLVGFGNLWVSHPDWSRLTAEETAELEDLITRDLRFDYTEDELDFWFEDSPDETYLRVGLHDRDDDAV
jgi:hypothetical protein